MRERKGSKRKEGVCEKGKEGVCERGKGEEGVCESEREGSKGEEGVCETGKGMKSRGWRVCVNFIKFTTNMS